MQSTAIDGRVVAQLVEALRCKPESRGFDSQWFHFEIFFDSILVSRFDRGFDSASIRNEYQEYFLGE